jgi:hypothetical protein
MMKEWKRPGLPRRLYKGLSRVMGNYHAQFLGGKGAVRLPTYPVTVEKGHTYIQNDTFIIALWVNYFSSVCIMVFIMM